MRNFLLESSDIVKKASIILLHKSNRVSFGLASVAEQTTWKALWTFAWRQKMANEYIQMNGFHAPSVLEKQ